MPVTVATPTLSLELLPDAAILLDGDGRVSAFNALAAGIFRCEALAGARFAQLLEDAARLQSALELALPGDAVPPVPVVGLRDGVPFRLDVSARRLADGVLCLLRDVGREQLPDEARRYLDEAFDAMPIGMALFNTDGEYVRVNDALCGLLGRTACQLIGVRDQEITHPEDRQSDLDAAWRILRGEFSSWQCEKRFVRPDGEVVWTLANLTFLRDSLGRPLCWVGQFQDISARRALEAELQRQASRDPLTDALNRRGFDLELAHVQDGTALLVIDLDGFKETNDVYGHEAGDELLCGIADAMLVRLRRGDVLARLGGDEFAVLLPGCDADEAERVAGDLVEVIASQRFSFGAVPRSITASIGVAMIDPGAPGEAVSAADHAMYAAKAAGGGQACPAGASRAPHSAL
jgi:diguanylate cyclase (GGDEF)-like protein/PAS domain S-box-containing protein